jgi:hypothetical protein
MECDLLIKNGRVIDPLNNMDEITDVAIVNDKVTSVGKNLNQNLSRLVISADNLLVIPGVVDSHAHVARPNSKGAGFRMLVKTGVTTAVDFEGPIEVINREISLYSCGLNVAVLEGIKPGNGFSGINAPHHEIVDKTNQALNDGAIGIKLLGGHYPLSPDTTADLIETAASENAYVAFHVGTTETGSNILGLEEAICLANGNPLHIAHVNAYCRGLIEDPLQEIYRAMHALNQADNVVSESHLAPFNGCSGFVGTDGLPESHVTRRCLETFGYSVNHKGIEQAILDSCAGVYALVDDEMQLLWEKDAREKWLEENTRVGLSFSVNNRVSALVSANHKNSKGTFTVEAISSDGGAIPRNYILTYGMHLVKFGALSLNDLVKKTSYNPAQLFGFVNKGHLSPGADADIALVDANTGEAKTTIIGGKVAMAGGIPIAGIGRVLTTERGAPYLKNKQVPHEIIDLEQSTYFNKQLKDESGKRNF